MGEESPSEMLLMHRRAVDAAHEAFVRAYRDDAEFRARVDRGRERVTKRWNARGYFFDPAKGCWEKKS